jgi:hypothetical protein
MKNKLLAVLATFGMVASASAVKINNNLSINGFIDGSYSSTDAGAGDTSTVGIDEVELNFLVNAGNVSGELHIDNNNDLVTQTGVVSDATADESNGTTTTSNQLDIEQVHFTYSFGNGATLTVGQFGSALGFEREDPAGLYTFSRAYSGSAFDLGNIDAVGSQEGFRLGYASGDLSASLALYNEDGSTLDNGVDNDDFDYEVALSYAGIDNLTVGAGIQNTRPATGADTEVYTINAAYTLNKVLLAAEYINSEVEGADDLSAYMILADYDVNEKLGVAIRYSNWETAANAETDKLTFAPNYSITESLGAIVEFSAEETSAGAETDSLAVELTYTF